MGQYSKISWTTHTFNPWIGCAKVSAGCKNCYAEALMDRRYGRVEWGEHGTRSVTSPANWRQPLKWDREAREAIHRDFTLEQRQAGEHVAGRPRVFCASLADVFEDRPELADPRARLFDLIDRTPFLDWLLLTKRPENIARMWPDHPGMEDDCDGEVVNIHVVGRDCDGMEGDCCWGSGWLPSLPWPVPSRSFRNNVWLGTSVEDQARADERIPHLLGCRTLAPVLFLSVEPLLGPIRLPMDNCNPCCPGDTSACLVGPEGCGCRLDWVIVGGESGPGHRPMEVAWIASIADQCAAAGVPLYVKQDSGPRDGMQGRIPEDLWAAKEFPRVPAEAAP